MLLWRYCCGDGKDVKSKGATTPFVLATTLLPPKIHRPPLLAWAALAGENLVKLNVPFLSRRELLKCTDEVAGCKLEPRHTCGGFTRMHFFLDVFAMIHTAHSIPGGLLRGCCFQGAVGEG